jgi:hypothetical protein
MVGMARWIGIAACAVVLFMTVWYSVLLVPGGVAVAVVFALFAVLGLLAIAAAVSFFRGAGVVAGVLCTVGAVVAFFTPMMPVAVPAFVVAAISGAVLAKGAAGGGSEAG